MGIKEINIEQVSGKKTVSREDGRAVYNKIEEVWTGCDRIRVNFSNLSISSVSFMDEAFGQLALKYSRDELKNKLEFVSMNNYDRALLNDIILSRIRQRTVDRKPPSKKRRRMAAYKEKRHR